jgi:uncharacterized membrane protein|uniref:DUF2177 family protein n=1 Tax=Desulfobacca acetoxidans TaxID=60893 RepID=A0A7V6A1G9_9BACT
MGHTIKLYLLVLVIFLAIDLTWLGVLMAKFYKKELGPLAWRSLEALALVWWAAFLVYFLIPPRIVLFVLPRITPDSMAAPAFGWRFLYGVYDLTNHPFIDRCLWA